MGVRWLKWLEREFTDRKVRGSKPTSASRLPLSRLRRPDSNPALVLPSGGMAARHRKKYKYVEARTVRLLGQCTGYLSSIWEKTFSIQLLSSENRPGKQARFRIALVWPRVAYASRPTSSKGSSRTTTRTVGTSQGRSNNDLAAKYESHCEETKLLWPLLSPWMGSPKQNKSMIRDIVRQGAAAPAIALVHLETKTKKGDCNASTNHSVVTRFRCLAAMPPKESTRVEILLGCPSLETGKVRGREIGFESRAFRSLID
ncbi:hypothetical protein T265_06938 [Opisthorchis viverrini]|uniref:Uncharacterized protein n=1 Tax=Opisthorchis viverrini TaxID=6198 RepID=A0A075ACW1_OPIVI|nr:hypothetical protein T265_06938 [Opisthorchis viverrini]KER25649.1 hypothetical protein T265_06938 [Opisthorchis viverrini]